MNRTAPHLAFLQELQTYEYINSTPIATFLQDFQNILHRINISIGSGIHFLRFFSCIPAKLTFILQINSRPGGNNGPESAKNGALNESKRRFFYKFATHSVVISSLMNSKPAQ